MSIRTRFSVKLAVSIISVLFNAGCMHMGMKMGKTMMGTMMTGFTSTVQQVNTGQELDQLITEAVSDLVSQRLAVNSIAVWQIKSKTAGVDVEMIRQKIITKLVNSNRYKVVTRQRLKELLAEHSLSLSGTIDESNAIEIGQLIGIEGFIDGYASLEENRFVLSLNLIETKSGVILWAKMIDRFIE